jgi:hypothetical protein
MKKTVILMLVASLVPLYAAANNEWDECAAGTWHFSPPCPTRSVPEPGTLLLVGIGLAALIKRRK